MDLKIRIFGLVAAISLTVGLYTPVYATSFIDDEYIQYKTAVGVMSGIGVINGYSNNSFRPTDNISREEAVKMITIALLGPKAASNLVYTTSSFSDVDPNRWSLPMIEWCAAKNIVSGRGDGSFDPTGKVTSYELAKMLLCAAGYGKNGEYTGASWDLNAVKDASAKGIFNSNIYETSGYATREQAALYIFNTIMNVELVKYSNGNYISADGTPTVDNTIASTNFGINHNSIISGIITGNSANGATGTMIGETGLSIKTGSELIGHYVTVYTNGKIGDEQAVYFVDNKSTTVKLEKPVSDSNSFSAAFGDNITYGGKIAVFNSKLVYDECEIEGFDKSSGKAPAGTYVIYNNAIVAYLA